MRGGARRPQVRRTLCTLNLRSRAPTKQMGLYEAPAAECLTHARKMGIRVWLPQRGRQSNPTVRRGDLLMSGVHTLRGPALFWLPALLVLILVTGIAGPPPAGAQAPTAAAQPPSAPHQGGGEANLKIPEDRKSVV